MITSKYEVIKDLCAKSGLEIAQDNLNIGREITYKEGLERIVVIHFIETDFPEVVRNTLLVILSIEDGWYFLNRFGSVFVNKYGGNESKELAETLINSFKKVEKENDDLYLISESGSILLSYDHHLFDDGMAVYLKDIDKTEKLLIKLNRIGGEFEIFSKNG